AIPQLCLDRDQGVDECIVIPRSNVHPNGPARTMGGRACPESTARQAGEACSGLSGVDDQLVFDRENTGRWKARRARHGHARVGITDATAERRLRSIGSGNQRISRIEKRWESYRARSSLSRCAERQSKQKGKGRKEPFHTILVLIELRFSEQRLVEKVPAAS